MQNIGALIENLRKLPNETEYVEFKRDFTEPEDVYKRQGITMAQGFAVAEPGKKHVAFVGDSTFFASGLPGIVNAVYNGHDVTVCVLDNATTAMTGSQPHPGTGVTLMGPSRAPVSIERGLQAVGFECIVHALSLIHIWAAQSAS